MSALLKLYPRAWRARHGDEMLALLEQHGAGWRTQLDLLRGAVDAHIIIRRHDMHPVAIGRSLLLRVIPGALLAIGYALAAPNLGISPGFDGAAFAAWVAICLVAGGRAGRDNAPTRAGAKAGLLTGVAGALFALLFGAVGSVVQMAAFAGSGHFLGTFNAGSMLVSQLGWPDAAILAAAGLAGAVLGLAAAPLAQALTGALGRKLAAH
jgi:hypothetical protein